MSDETSWTSPLSRERGGEAPGPVARGPAALAERDPGFGTGANDDSGAGEMERGVDRAREHRRGPAVERGRESLRAVEAVLDREHHGVGPDQRGDRAGAGLGVVRLDAEQQEIDRLEAPDVRHRGDGEGQLSVRSADGEAASLQRLQVRAPRDEHDLVPGLGQDRPVVAADAARAEHRDPHG